MSAWRDPGDFGKRSSLRNRLYQIATNRCLSMLRATGRRPPNAAPLPDAPLPEPVGTDAPPWLEPYPDVLLEDVVDRTPGQGVRYGKTEAISLDFITALQLLPPDQRAALVLRDVLGYGPAEVAEMIGASQEAVNSALNSARATVDSHLADTRGTGAGSSGTGTGSSTNGSNSSNSSTCSSANGSNSSNSSTCSSANGSSGGSGGSGGNSRRRPVRLPDLAAEHRLVARFTDALERADLDALIGLLVADVRLSMPPAMLEYRGIESAERVFAAVTFRAGRTYRVVPTRANGQPAFGLYLADPHADVYRAYAFLVITVAGDSITAITAFSTNVMPRFGLPRTLPETD